MAATTKPTSRPKAGARASRSSSGRRSGAGAKRCGSTTPRIFTPPLRPLNRRTSLGYDVIDFADWIRDRLEEIAPTAEDPDYVLGLFPRLLEWQRWLLIHALELLPGPEKIFRFRTVLLLVARQNGKSTLLTALILWRLFQDDAKMIIETHISLEHASKAWYEAVNVAEEIPELADEIGKKLEGKTPSVQLDVSAGAGTFKIASTNRRGGRGFSGDLVIFDELREHQDFKSWSATSKTTMARKRAQVWGMSNAGDTASVLLRHLRTIALAAIDGTLVEGIPKNLVDGLDLDSIGIFEWSAGEINGRQRGIWDRDGWAEANPSMGYTELDERAIASAAMSDPEWEFRTEVLCQFVNTAGAGPFPNGAWQRTLELRVQRDTSRPFTYCLDLSHDRAWLSVAVAFWDTDGRRRVELVARRAGTDWIVPWLESPLRRVKPEHVTLQITGAPVSSIVKKDDDEDEYYLSRSDGTASSIRVTPWGGPDLARAHGQFYDRMRLTDDDGVDIPPTLTHNLWPALDIAATTAVIKPLGDGWAIDRQKSPQDAAPLVATIGAHWLLLKNPQGLGPSIYEQRGLIVL